MLFIISLEIGLKNRSWGIDNFLSSDIYYIIFKYWLKYKGFNRTSLWFIEKWYSLHEKSSM